MKINIGKYKDWIGPYQIAEWFQLPEHEELWLAEKLSNTWLNDLCLWIDSRRDQKIQVRIDDHDTWSMDTTLSHIVVPMLKQLKAINHGSPFVSFDDVPEYLVPSYKEHIHTDPMHEYRWNWVLSEMIFAFESKLIEWEDQFYLSESKFHFEHCIDSDASVMIYDSEPNIDWHGIHAYQARIDNGFRLFGKYYNSLRD